MKKRKLLVKVLPEEEYEEALDHIITRDYFPALPFMTGEHSALKKPKNEDSPSLDYSYEGGSFEDDDETPQHRQQAGRQAREDISQPSEAELAGSQRHDLSLNDFVKFHTSEDNKAFDDIQQKDEEKRKQKYAWMYEQEKFNRQLLELHGSDPNRSGVVAMWKYKAKNMLMHPAPAGEPGKDDPDDPTDLASTDPLLIEGPPDLGAKVDPESVRIVPENTRFPDDFFNAPKPKDLLADQQSDHPGATPQVNGYKLMRSPDVDPESRESGMDASPLITWGDVLSTPLHLREEDTEPEQLSKKTFQVPPTPSREELGMRLSQQASRAIRKREQAKHGGKSTNNRRDRSSRQRIGSSVRASPSPLNRHLGSSTPRTPQLSPAGLRLLQARQGSSHKTKSKRKGNGFDAQLRASYTPTLAHLPGSARGSSSSSSSSSRSSSKRAYRLNTPNALLTPSPRIHITPGSTPTRSTHGN